MRLLRACPVLVLFGGSLGMLIYMHLSIISSTSSSRTIIYITYALLYMCQIHDVVAEVCSMKQASVT